MPSSLAAFATTPCDFVIAFLSRSFSSSSKLIPSSERSKSKDPIGCDVLSSLLMSLRLMVSWSLRMTARSMTDSSCRIFPGQVYSLSALSAAWSTPRILLPNSRLYFALKKSASSGISSLRSLRGGSWIVTTLSGSTGLPETVL